MGPLPIRATPYRAAMNGDWKGMVDHYQERVLDVPLPVTLSADTALHLAVYSKQGQPLKDLLEIVKDIKELLPETEFLLPDETKSRVPEIEPETESPVPETESLEPEIQFLKRKNKFGNTALHEATIYGNYEAARLLVERCPDLLKEKNNYGETPLFTAAGFAETDIVEFLIRSEPEKCVDCNGRILSIHRKRKEDNLSILSAAIRGQHFETALLLLQLDGSLHKLKDKDGVTALQLLAQMPTAFESGFPMGICERLICCCLPVKRHHKVKSQVEAWFKERKRLRDLESGQGKNSEDLGSGSLRNQRGGILKYLKVPKVRWLEGFWNQKRKHVFALRLAEILIKKDESLNKVQHNKGRTGRDCVGIINQYPHAVEHLNEEGQSILDVAVKHRQENIFSLVKHQKIPLARLHRVVDKKGNTLLHHVADMEHYRGGTKPGPALKLQEEFAMV
nr:uncharacterized protein LOC118045265 [Populus alba]